MTNESRPTRVYRLVLDALELPETKRADFLSRECGDDTEFRKEVEALLAIDLADTSVLHSTHEDSSYERPTLPVGRVANATLALHASQLPKSPTVDRIRHYRVDREIGRGGMGVVYEGTDEKLERRVAIKSIRWDLVSDEEKRDRFREEARLLAALDHPSIGSIYSFEETPDGHFLILEFVEGRTLGQVVGRGAMPLDDAVDVARQIADALSAAHERGIVHRDLSPGNVMVREDGVAKVLDFGLARSIGVAKSEQTRSSGPVVGTPSFMSPELLTGGASTRAADSWAFACLLFECLTGERAFIASTLPGIFDQILHGPLPLDSLPDTTPTGVVELLERCWVRDPDQRLDDMRVCHRLLSGSMEVGPPKTAIDRWPISWQPLAKRVKVDGPIVARLHIENPTPNDAEVELRVEPSHDWTPLRTIDRTTTVAGRNSCEVRFALSPRQAGALRLPTIELVVGDERRKVRPVPSTINVDPRATESWVGRTRELRWFENWLGDPTAHAGCAVVVQGDEGAGRSAFLDRVTDLALEREFRVVRAKGRSGATEPLEVLSDLVRSYLGVFEPLRERDPRIEVVKSRLRELIGEASPAARYFLDLLRGVDLAVLEASMQQYRCYQLFGAAATSGPILFVIDDMESADPTSMSLIESVLSRTRVDGLPILAVASTLRDSNSERVLSNEVVEKRTELPPFDIEATNAFIDALFPGANHRDYLPDLAEMLRQRTSGQPGPLRETLRSLGREDGTGPIFELSDDGWRTRPDVDIEPILDRLPSTYAELIEERLESVPDEHRKLLEYAALLGSRFSVDALAPLSESEDTVDDALDAFESQGIVEPTDADLSHYRFSFSILPQQILARLDGRGSRRAARMRREAAAALLANHDARGTSARESEELGLQLIALGQLEQAMPHLIVALGQRVRQRQVPEAQRILRRAQELETEILVDDPPRRFEWHSLEGRTLTLAGHLDAAEQATEAARLVAEQNGDSAGVLLCRVHLAEIAIRRGRFEVGRDLAFAVRERAKELDLDAIHREATRNLAIAYQLHGESDLARQIWNEDLERCVAEDDHLGEIRAQNNLGILLYHTNDWESAEARFDRAASLAKSLDQPDLEMIARVWLANIAFERGDLDSAESLYRNAIQQFQMLQNRRALSRCYFNLGQVGRLQGRATAAVEDYQRACELCDELEDARTSARYRLDLIDCALDAGDEDRAREEWSELQTSAGTAFDTQHRDLHAIVAQRLGDVGVLQAILGELEPDAGSPTVLGLLALLREDPSRAEDANFEAAAREVLATSRSFSELRHRVQLTTEMEAAQGRVGPEATLDPWIAKDLASPIARAWIEQSRSVD